MGRFPEPGDGDLLAGPSRNFQVFEPLDFLAEVTQHIPDFGEHLVRHYGWYSNKTRGLEVKASADRVEIRTRYPERNKNHSGSVEYTLKVPRRARLDKVSCVNGEVSVQDVTAGVEASTVNGRLRATGLAGDTKLSSVNGAVEGAFTTFEGVESISLNTVNGAITLALPADADARIKAHTLNGGLKNDFGLAEKKGQFVGRDLKATLGKGTTAVDLDTVNGAIRIAKSPQ